MNEQQKQAVKESAEKYVKALRGMISPREISNVKADFNEGAEEVINHPEKYGLQPINEWVSVSDRLPIAWETGGWDGKRTDEVLIRKTGDRYTIGRLYTGVLDGRVFTDWIEGKEEWSIYSGEVTHWQPLPPINEREEG
jgi:hypothetical protein